MSFVFFFFFRISSGFFSANGLGGFNNPLLSSQHSQDPFMQPTFKSHAASHHNAFGTQGQTYKQNPDGTYSTIGGEFKAYGSFTPASESLEGDAEPKIDTDFTLLDHSSGTDETLKPGSIVAANGGFSNASSLGGMGGNLKEGPGLGAMGGFNAGGGIGAGGMGIFNGGGAAGFGAGPAGFGTGPAGFGTGAAGFGTGAAGFGAGAAGFGAGAAGRSNHNANVPGAVGFSQFGEGRSPFGKSSGVMVDKDVEKLMDMGFKRAVAKKALKQGCNHFQVALNMLLGVSLWMNSLIVR